MAKRSPVGGGNLLQIFAIDTSTGDFDTLEFSFNKTVGTSVTGHPLKGAITIDLDGRIDDKALNSFYESYLNDAVVEVQDIEYEDSSKDTIVSGLTNAQDFGFVWYGAEDDSAEIKVIVGRGVLSGDTGSFSTGVKQLVTATAQITSINGMTVKLTSDKFETATKIEFVSAWDVEVGNEKYGSVAFLSAKA